jgi:hypothetical protein
MSLQILLSLRFPGKLESLAEFSMEVFGVTFPNGRGFK